LRLTSAFYRTGLAHERPSPRRPRGRPARTRAEKRHRSAKQSERNPAKRQRLLNACGGHAPERVGPTTRPLHVVLTRAGNVTDIETKSQRTRKTQDSTHHSNAVSTRSHRTRRQVPPATQGTAESSAPLITMDGIAAAHNRHAASQLLSPTGRRILVVAAAQLRASHSRRRRD
jgi:hypothetical protein